MNIGPPFSVVSGCCRCQIRKLRSRLTSFLVLLMLGLEANIVVLVFHFPVTLKNIYWCTDSRSY